MPKAKPGEAKPAKGAGDDKIMFLVAYIFTWLTGLIIYFTKGKEDDELRFHAVQAIGIGIAQMCVMVVGFALFFLIITPILAMLVNICLWGYGIYIGYTAYSKGERIMMPFIGEYAEKYAKEPPK